MNKDTYVFIVNLYLLSGTVNVCVDDYNIQLVHDLMCIPRKKRKHSLCITTHADVATMRARPDLCFIVDIEGKSILGYSFSNRGLLNLPQETIAEGIH